MTGTVDHKVEDALQMNALFLSTFLRVALQQTGAERGMACDADLKIIELVNMDQQDVLSDRFTGFETMKKAFRNGQAVITNNAVMDPALAPVTNTNFSNLKVVVVIPVQQSGAVYLDQPIRQGIFSKDIVDRLVMLADYAYSSDQLESSEDELNQLYAQIG